MQVDEKSRKFKLRAFHVPPIYQLPLAAPTVHFFASLPLSYRRTIHLVTHATNHYNKSMDERKSEM